VIDWKGGLGLCQLQPSISNSKRDGVRHQKGINVDTTPKGGPARHRRRDYHGGRTYVVIDRRSHPNIVRHGPTCRDESPSTLAMSALLRVYLPGLDEDRWVSTLTKQQPNLGVVKRPAERR
jgi:hypothetical protein